VKSKVVYATQKVAIQLRILWARDRYYLTRDRSILLVHHNKSHNRFHCVQAFHHDVVEVLPSVEKARKCASLGKKTKHVWI
jgi:hypothetical protein